MKSRPEGLIYIGDRLVKDVPAKDRDIAMAFQNYAPYQQRSRCQEPRGLDRKSDQTLYQAKKSGKNRFFCFEVVLGE